MSAALLGPPGPQRLRAGQSLLALVIYGLFAGLQYAEVRLGLIDANQSLALAASYMAVGTLFYLAIRSGFNQRFVADPSLSMAQALFGLASLVWSYSITGPARGAVMTLLVLILVFTMFALRPAQSRALAVAAFACLTIAMGWKAHTDPARYPPAVEVVHLFFAAVVTGGVSLLAGQMGKMRDRLKSQKLKLQQALDRISELALRDELTGLYNRRHVTTLLATELSRQGRDGTPLTIAVLDIDFFKRVNDAHGHEAGDKVLERFAQVGLETLRSTDVLARWGGEEFLLMLPNSTVPQAELSVERLREGLKASSYDVAPGLQVTFSAGLSGCHVGDSIEACVNRADQAMYLAKRHGRDRSVVA